MIDSDLIREGALFEAAGVGPVLIVARGPLADRPELGEVAVGLGRWGHLLCWPVAGWRAILDNLGARFVDASRAPGWGGPTWLPVEGTTLAGPRRVDRAADGSLVVAVLDRAPVSPPLPGDRVN